MELLGTNIDGDAINIEEEKSGISDVRLFHGSFVLSQTAL